DTARGAFVMPATTPTQFDPQQAHDSVDRILSFHPQAIFVTHYSRRTDVERLGADMHTCLDQYVEIAQACTSLGEHRVAEIKHRMHDYLVERVRAHGCTADQATVDSWLEMDVDLNAQGLVFWQDRISR
ncbi:MAG: MBL fold metallo-hydrolase, partial [Rhodanobacteraceae bacterium]